MNISKKRKIIIGSIIAVLIVVGLLFFTKPTYQKIRTSPYPEYTLKIRQLWHFGDFSVKVEETAVVMLPQEGPMFIIKMINNEIKDERKRREYAKQIAFLVYKNKIYEQANVLKINGKPIVLLPKIGIAIIEKQGTGMISKFNGHRYQFPFSELQ
jgi:hypothetical protein